MPVTGSRQNKPSHVVQEMKDERQVAYRLPSGDGPDGQAVTAVLDAETETDHVRFAQVSTPQACRGRRTSQVAPDS